MDLINNILNFLQNDSHEHCNTPFSNGHVYQAFLQESELLTKGDDVKRSYRMRLDIKVCFFRLSEMNSSGSPI